MKNISIHIHHNTTISIDNNGEYIILEAERFFHKKHYNIKANPPEVFKEKFQSLLKILDKNYNIDNKFDNCTFTGINQKNQVSVNKVNTLLNIVKSLLICNNYHINNHHHSHAACAFYQSPYNEALIISFDGSGNDGKFNIYHGKNQEINIIKKFDVISLGKSYRKVALSLKEINKLNPDNTIKKLITHAGKLMGLCAYGNFRPEWIHDFRKLYNSYENNINIIGGRTFINPNIFKQHILHNNELNNFDVYEGQFAYDIAKTNQHFFEDKFYELSNKYIKEYKLPIVLSGGCALNVLLNEKVRIMYGNNVFIPPNPDDSGISFGGLMILNPPDHKVDITYSGCPILDLEILDEILNNFPNEKVDIKNVAELLKKGNIIGVMQGNSEIGPRALGNRSIICDPRFPNMKDKLNKIKNREWFRPFAPAVRYEDRNKYFEFDHESRFMSFAPIVREEYRKLFPSITHVDNTARVQTVKREQHEFFYDIMTELDSIILNTSFNINGEPMVTTVKDAIYALENTSLDYIIINDYLIKSRN